ncbi:MAG: hypothetical protein V3S65_06335 [Candidatus Aminicenantaceae bacterium]
MKKSIIVCLLGIIVLPITLEAQDRGFGLGVILGEPTGVSFKKWVGRREAFDVAVAWSFEGEGAIHIHADYLFHNFRLFNIEKGDLVFYYGIGGRVKTVDKTQVGVRIPLGLSYLFEKDPVEIFFELGPILNLTPKTLFRMTTGVGVRYYFNK